MIVMTLWELIKKKQLKLLIVLDPVICGKKIRKKIGS